MIPRPSLLFTSALAVTLAMTVVTRTGARPMHAEIDYERYLQEADAIGNELDAWMDKYGAEAEAQGWLPSPGDRSADEVREDRKQRFFMAKELVADLARRNPEGEFSTDSQFTLLTTEEFRKYVANAYLEGGGPAQQRRLRQSGAGDAVAFNPRQASFDFPKERNTDGIGKVVAESVAADHDPRQNSHRQDDLPPSPNQDSTTSPPTQGPTQAPPTPTPSPAPSPVTPGTTDWSTHQCMPPIQNQGSCSSCWAFATVSVAETSACLVSGSFQKYSEQHVTSCDSAGSGCNGGRTGAALEFIRAGVCMAQEVPYTSSNGALAACNTGCQRVSTGMRQVQRIEGAEAELVAGVAQGPVVVALAAGNPAWKQYRGGVISACETTQLDHAVAVVGVDATTFKIRNSWGANWGERGYVRLQRTGGGGKGVCQMYSEMYRAIY